MLSKDEFFAFFRDGALSIADLHELFTEMDTDASGSIDINELTA